MYKTGFLHSGLLVAMLLAAPLVQAQVSAEQAARLGQDLTPLGAEKAGNAAGTIPAWDGGLAPRSDAFDPVAGYKDPFAADQPLFSISHANAAQYSQQLSPGQRAMLARYPDSWKLQVYPTRRSASYPDKVYAAIKANATSAKLIADGNGIADFKTATPFPIPQSALEVLWNHLVRYRGDSVKRYYAQAVPHASGDYFMTQIEDLFLFNQDAGDASKDNGNVLFYFRQSVLAPARLAGTELLVHETVDQVKEPRLAWLYAAGQRRVRRTPNVAYDSPGTASEGMRTTDNFDMFSGAPDRYDWKLMGKEELYVPYNNYRFAAKTNKYSDIVKAGHVNPDLLRYELHRVWHVRATLKAGERHQYKQRDFYFDEDSYQILVVDHYDNRDNLWRLGESYTINMYDQPLIWTKGDAVYDLIGGRYVIGILSNEEPADQFDIALKPTDFTPAQLRRDSRR
ncbi:DUF1329 domain-containing protein [Aquipseudomonas guryensis]|jgi:hypothetical protein|uniref:DUF1329 domain-containing protein n=1 Tax=Aquipseudomonas guryensis TaxID=2759165 RepID=A0A7W4D9J7_9GAMM|nr:DUF1329 domain-containing protein [Pseudomonas guryensis]MBB1518521.1 DUF1329 domain-containing protein [Pseudomonas guryensis]